MTLYKTIHYVNNHLIKFEKFEKIDESDKWKTQLKSNCVCTQVFLTFRCKRRFRLYRYSAYVVYSFYYASNLKIDLLLQDIARNFLNPFFPNFYTQNATTIRCWIIRTYVFFSISLEAVDHNSQTVKHSLPTLCWAFLRKTKHTSHISFSSISWGS